ncbi:hypothetical protein BGZ76_002528, partial [Entomortierella beljakovae]
MTDSVQKDQPFRGAYRNELSTPTSIPEAEVVYIPTHRDEANGRDIVLWDDISSTFDSPLYVRNGSLSVPFIKGDDFKILEPRRIQAYQDVVLNVIVKGITKFKNYEITEGNTLVDETIGFKERNTASGYVNNTSCPPPTLKPGLNLFQGVGHGDTNLTTINSTVPKLPIDNLSKLSQHIDNNTQQLVITNDRDCKSYYEIALMYEEGNGVQQNYSKAIENYRLAAEEEPRAQYKVGMFYQKGYSVLLDYSKAMEWYLKSAGQGNPDAQRNIGILYENGQGVPQDYSKAME